MSEANDVVVEYEPPVVLCKTVVSKLVPGNVVSVKDIEGFFILETKPCLIG